MPNARRASAAPAHPTLSRGQVAKAMTILIALMFSKFIYLASFTSYYTFYLIDKFGLLDQDGANLPVRVLRSRRGRNDRRRTDRRQVGPQARDLGVDPGRVAFHACCCRMSACCRRSPERRDRLCDRLSLSRDRCLWAGVDAGPRRHGVGLFFGFVFGIGGIGAAALGALADLQGIRFVFLLCSFLPAIGVLAVFLPNLRATKRPEADLDPETHCEPRFDRFGRVTSTVTSMPNSSPEAP